MPAGKRQQSSAMLYSLVVFVGLFIVATALAVIFYVKFEDQSRKARDAQSNLAEMVTGRDRQDIGKIVGTVRTTAGDTYLGKMVDYLNSTVSAILGPLGSLGDSSAEVKVDTVNKRVSDILKLAQENFEQTIDPNVTGLVTVIQNLKASLDRTLNEKAALEKTFSELQQHFDDAIAATREKEKQLEEEKEQYHQQVVDVTGKYEELKQLMEKTSDERAATLYAQLEETENNLKRTNDELLKTQAELNMTGDRMERALQELQQIKPSIDTEVAAYKPDGKVILVDDSAGVAYLNIGSDDHVYPGLTFSVYDRNAPIPRDGKGKAEVEVFSVAEKVSSARITDSQKKNPIAVNDAIANLVWDSDKTNIFVVSGEFDLDGDGTIDYNAADKVKALIEKWGGRIADVVTFDTDFLVLGEPPQVPPKPTPEELDADPMADERYEAAMQRFNRYKEAEEQAKVLWVPVFTYDRFLYFIGYKGQSAQAGAF
jgi:hypothetical protein